nr:hypothetical protein [Tanacetum cinerariifolium]
MPKAFPLLVTEFPLPEELPTAREDSCHCQKKREATARKIALLSMSRRNCQSKVAVTLIAKIPILDTRKFEQWQFLIQQYLQHEHYALWEVIEFRDSYEVPTSTTDTTTTDTTSGETGKKISIQGSGVAGFDKSKVECFNCHKMGYFARECRAPRSQDRGRKDNFRQRSKAEEQASKALMPIDGVGWDWSYMANDGEDHALVADEEALTEFALMANTNIESKDGVDGKLAGLLTASKDLDNLIESQKADKNKEGLGYSAVPPPPAQLYSSPKKDLSWTGLPKCKDDIVTDYSRHEPTVESSPDDAKKRNPSISETVRSPITPKPFVKFVKASDSQSKSKTDETETLKKSPVKYAEQYRKTNKKPNVRGNQRNWNNLKSHQLGPDFVMKKKACFNRGDFNHLAYDYKKRVKRGTTRS